MKTCFASRLTLRTLIVLLICPLGVRAGGVVTECTEAALREAMAGGGTVTFACDGTILLGDTLTNDVNITFDGAGHQVILNGSNTVRVFYVQPGVTASLMNLTIANGGAGQGAGLFNDGGSVNLKGVSFVTNQATTIIDFAQPPWQPGFPQSPGAGGAIYQRTGTLNATNCSFIANSASQPIHYDISLDARGGAIFVEQGELNLDACLLSGNSANGRDYTNILFGSFRGPGGSGGAIYNSGQLLMNRCTLRENAALGGDGSPAISSTPIGGPAGNAQGGALFNSGVLFVHHSSFISNACTAGDGGVGLALPAKTGQAVQSRMASAGGPEFVIMTSPSSGTAHPAPVASGGEV
jgi:hypothetical protein